MNKDYINSEYLLCVNVEDTTYMLWQLELFIWSVTNNYAKKDGEIGLVNPKDILVVFIVNQNTKEENQKFELSTYAKSIIEFYDVRYTLDVHNIGNKTGLVRFRGDNHFGSDTYKPINKPWSMAEIWRYLNQSKDPELDKYKFIVILEADLLAYGGVDFDKFPKDKTSIAQHWITDLWTGGNSKMSTKQGEGSHNEVGERDHFNRVQENASLTTLLEIAGVSTENIEKFVPGACIIWIKREDFTVDFIDNSLLWTQLMTSLTTLKTGEILYVSELPVYSMALSHCGVDVEKISNEKFPEFNPGNMDSQVYGNEIPIRSLIHYTYPHIWPLKNGPHHGDPGYFNKRCYGQTSCPQTDENGKIIEPTTFPLNSIFDYVDDLKSGKESGTLQHQKAFFDYCLEIGKNVKIDRTGGSTGDNYSSHSDRTLMVIPHPDDELVFLSKFLKEVDEIICAVKPNDDARIESFLNWKNRIPFNRSFVGLPDYVPNGNIEFIPNFDDELDEALSNFNGKIVIPGFNHEYGHPHHIQLEQYMRKKFLFSGKLRKSLDKKECELKESNFKECYPTWIHMLNDTISESLPGDNSSGSKLWRDFFMSGVEEALVFIKE